MGEICKDLKIRTEKKSKRGQVPKSVADYKSREGKKEIFCNGVRSDANTNALLSHSWKIPNTLLPCPVVSDYINLTPKLYVIICSQRGFFLIICLFYRLYLLTFNIIFYHIHLVTRFSKLLTLIYSTICNY